MEGGFKEGGEGEQPEVLGSGQKMHRAKLETGERVSHFSLGQRRDS